MTLSDTCSSRLKIYRSYKKLRFIWVDKNIILKSGYRLKRDRTLLPVCFFLVQKNMNDFRRYLGCFSIFFAQILTEAPEYYSRRPHILFWSFPRQISGDLENQIDFGFGFMIFKQHSSVYLGADIAW